MSFLEHPAVKQLIDSLDRAVILDMVAIRVAILYEEGKTEEEIVNIVIDVLRPLLCTAEESCETTIAKFVKDNKDKDIDKYDGYGPEGYRDNTGLLRMGVVYEKNDESKIVRNISINFSTVVGKAQNFGLPSGVTVTEILPVEEV